MAVREGPDRLRVKLREADAFGGHPVNIRRTDQRRSVAAQIIVSLIVRENNDEVGFPLPLGNRYQLPQQQGSQKDNSINITHNSISSFQYTSVTRILNKLPVSVHLQ
jgi:hypothetical protein